MQNEEDAEECALNYDRPFQELRDSAIKLLVNALIIPSMICGMIHYMGGPSFVSSIYTFLFELTVLLILPIGSFLFLMKLWDFASEAITKKDNPTFVLGLGITAILSLIILKEFKEHFWWISTLVLLDLTFIFAILVEFVKAKMNNEKRLEFISTSTMFSIIGSFVMLLIISNN